MAAEHAHATLVVDGDDRVVAGNDAAAVVFGRDVAALTGETLDELVDAGMVASDAVDAYREAAAAGESSFRAAMRPGDAAPRSTYDVTIESGEGDRTVLALTDVGRLGGEADTVTALHAATRELIRADSREAAFETAANAASRVLGFPATGVRAYDEARDELVHVAFGGRVNDPDERPPVAVDETPHGEAFRSGETVIHEVEAGDDLYDELLFSYTMYVPVGEHGVVTLGTFGSEFDETDVRLAELLAENTAAALRQLEQREELERQNERLAEFAGVVAHDLRNPLAVASGSLARYRDTGREEFGERAADALDRMDGIVDDVLALARGGTDIENPTPVSLAAAAREAWGSVPTGEATLTVAGDRTVHGDRGRLLRLFENLFRNALEHGGAGEVTVAETDRGFVVEDDGTGFDPAVRESALDAGVSSNDDGTGLGLAIVADAARAHGFEVALADADGGGGRVVFATRDPAGAGEA
jgi:signal transduction histidine kinase